MNQRIDSSLAVSALAALALAITGCSGGGGGDTAPPQGVPLDTAASRVTANPNATVLADGTAFSTIVVELLDENGQPVANEQVTLEVDGTGNLVTQPATPTDAGGRTQGAVAATSAGTRTVTAIVTRGGTQLRLDNGATIRFVDPTVPELTGLARYEDADRSGTANAGDRLIARFTLPVSATGATIGDFTLPVTGDSFGTNATVVSGPAGDEVTIRLGDGAALRTRGRFAAGATAANDPSGLALAPSSTGIVATSGGASAVPTAPVDIVPSFEPAPIDLPVTGGTSIAPGDVNRDGNIDLWIGRTNGSQLFIGDGDLGFTPGSQFGNQLVRDVVIGQFNRFGAVDIATAQSNGIQLWENSSLAGTLSVSESTLLASPNAEILLATDLNSDGYTDLIAGTTNGVQIWEQQRSLGLQFDLRATLGAGQNHAVDFGDVDGDGDVDVVAGAQGQSPRIFLNDGALAFTPGAQLPVSSAASDLELADFDADGDLDVLVALGAGNSARFRNDGGAFVPTDAGFAADRMRAGDEDRDLRPGVVALSGGEVVVLANDGAGAFADTGARPAQGDAVTSIELADLDVDGDLDIVSLDGQGASVRSGSSTGTWGTTNYAETAALGTEDSVAVALGDFDADGDLDLVQANIGPDMILLNDGTGTFSHSGQAGHVLTTGVTSAVAIGDMDGDRDLDIVTGSPAGIPNESNVWVNDGTGNFTLGLTFGGDLDTLSVALGDIDDDGDLDVVLGNRGANQVFRNDSFSGNLVLTFRPTQLPASPDNAQESNALLLVDVDRDADLDLVVGNGELISGEQNQYFSNDGAGTFVFLRNLPGAAQPTFSLAAADFDGDGDLDIAVGNRGNGNTIENEIVFGFGNGQFQLQTERFSDGAHDTRGLAPSDIDGDGDLDLLAADVGVNSFRTWLNDGSGAFTLGQAIGNHNSSGFAAGDLDHDGDADALVANRLNQPNRVYLNQ